MTRNPLAAIPRSASRLPRMAPDMTLLPAGRIVTLTDDVTTRLYDTGEEHLTPVVLLHGMAATGTGAQRNALEKITMGSLTRGAPVLNAVPVEVAREIDDEVPSAYTWAMRELASVPLATHRTVITEVARFNSTSWLHELELPVAVVKTMRDIAFPRWIQDEMADLLPHSAVFPISAGHAACATHPGTFARRMRTAIGWVVSNSH